MIEFFRDVISGPVYIVAVILSVIFIMAIIGFLMERKKLEKEHNEQVAIVTNNQNVQPINNVESINNVQPINPIMVEQQVVTNQVSLDELTTNNKTEDVPVLEVNKPTIVSNDTNQTI